MRGWSGAAQQRYDRFRDLGERRRETMEKAWQERAFPWEMWRDLTVPQPVFQLHRQRPADEEQSEPEGYNLARMPQHQPGETAQGHSPCSINP